MGRNQKIALIIGMIVTAILMVTEVVGSIVLAIVIGTFVTVIIGAELNSLSRKAQNKYSSKFTKEDYFINEKTKEWVEKNVNSLNAIFKKIDKESRLLEIIMKDGYQNIEIVTENGSIIKCNNTQKIKL